jgi:hypothetical protein
VFCSVDYFRVFNSIVGLKGSHSTGTFDRHIAVPLPNIRGCTQILVQHEGNHCQSRCRSYDFGLGYSRLLRGQLAKHGQVGFRIVSFIQAIHELATSQAAIQASKEQAKAVVRHLEWVKVGAVSLS